MSDETRYIVFEEYLYRTEGTDQPEVASAVFERMLKTWRRIRGSGTDNDAAWDYQIVYRGESAPGYDTPEDAVQALIDTITRNIENKRRTLVREEARLAKAEAYLRGMSEEVQP